MNILYYSLDLNEFNIIFSCISAKQIWNKLEITYEGVNQEEKLSFQEDKEDHPNLGLMTHENEKKKKKKKK